ALRRHHNTYYIWLRRRPVISGPTASDPAIEMSLSGFLRFIRKLTHDNMINVYFNSSNTYFPGLSTVLRLVAATGIWCLDMHDDLRYHNTGFKRWRETLIISLLRRLSHVTVHAAPTLQELFPDSQHLGNASNILPLARANSVTNDVLIIASFDERFDFEFLSKLAQARPELQFHLYGWTRPDATATMQQIKAIDTDFVNIHYHGPYNMADLPSILAAYQVSVAPYRINTLLTRYIDPLRFYHCLNAGLEVISSDIPQARYMHDWLHVVPNVAACARTLAAIRSGALAKQPAYSPITWEQRADRLVEIIRALPRTGRLRRKRAGRGIRTA
ncbi:MAG: hypothetical protein M3Y22_13685, partial [Pseudomonadota bacterium]|nr:hypothetical protein [Pseudomonadota bacterium]